MGTDDEFAGDRLGERATAGDAELILWLRASHAAVRGLLRAIGPVDDLDPQAAEAVRRANILLDARNDDVSRLDQAHTALLEQTYLAGYDAAASGADRTGRPRWFRRPPR